MTVNRLADYLAHMRQAIADAQWDQVLPLAYLTFVRLRGPRGMCAIAQTTVCTRHVMGF